ncbi:geranylgeranyl diphosphate synthase, type I [Amycolatopsis arida]|uniref:Geranylgeranyl diphosphate synthase, type I n=1 Tax=Amycolatopsis arida TaxID=587909 RepID=A0A1I5P1P6_9PSEU|nr:polyprenyl synthetase family protein [Amycolatopsis arida]TDX98323.1 geranylgeranyl diphosphate synthase type I [Amycolatopsis arida]SFP27969.1 geranylgeranyl diphosphate synthase, type I [Amycolatopsis arida]
MTASTASGRRSPGPRVPAPAELRDRVDRELAEFLDRGEPEFTSPPALHEVFRLLRRFVLGGGKRIRPLFCYWGWRGAGGADCAEIVRAAAALELFQAFALMHDDIMDGSELRRGEPALHRALTDLHARHAWRGREAHFGMSVAILCGDLCLSYSDEMLHGCGLPDRRVRAAQELVHRMRTEVMIGQNLDLLDQATGGTLEGALTIIRFKAAKYTIERPLQIGAVLAGAGPELLAAYSDFAIPLGEAFQLRDDVLGVFGDSAVTGKPTLDDLREGKPTVLIALARQRVSAAQAAQLAELHGNDRLDEEGAATLRSIIAATGALTAVEDMIRERHERALAAAAAIPVPDEVRRALLDLAAAATVRSS